jgi:hypothetical protein
VAGRGRRGAPPQRPVVNASRRRHWSSIFRQLASGTRSLKTEKSPDKTTRTMEQSKKQHYDKWKNDENGSILRFPVVYSTGMFASMF